jgi:5-methylcytosine-specific restriction enzyme A
MRTEFSNVTKQAAWQLAKGCCAECGELIGENQPREYDHIKPCAFGGRNDLDNCQVLCLECHRKKTAKTDVPAVAKSNRVVKKHAAHVAEMEAKKAV